MYSTQTMDLRKIHQPTVPDICGKHNYINPAACTVNKMPATSDKKCSSFARTLPLLAVFWLTLLAVTGCRTFFTFLIYKNNTRLIEENYNLMTQNKNLTDQIKNMKTKFAMHCKYCQKGWMDFQSSCYAINNAEAINKKTWEEARENCRGKISDLAVVMNEPEKTFVADNSWGSSGTSGYWIGLRVEDGKWKWVNGSDLTDNLWVKQPPISGQCAISVFNEGWKSVSCKNKNQWICEKEPISL
ncbi:killer cell lectin-like receptor subfamily B member 1B allele C [Mugil cephalus]|uniref:killer cell lectin-like receptor subfamily B member 1B allele C n=1 Tax=Mugil cephalus TaxID=48193 RepID=UPI001FB5BFD9|nr:killer cell lectin-like receptor subfamily B member 1B allele C [Mugil cephalus]